MLKMVNALLLILAIGAWANIQKTGEQIAQNMRIANDGFIGANAEMEMILIDAYGSQVTRLMQSQVKESGQEGDRALLTFLNPKDVRGTKMLTRSNKNADDDQWLYLPALRRVKRISSSNRSTSFMGSEFSYEDLGSQRTDRYDYDLLREETYRGHETWVLKRVSKRKSAYSKHIMYVSRQYMNPLKIEYYDRADKLLKVATFSDYKLFQVHKKDLYRAGKIHMKNVQTRKESIFVWNKLELGVSLNDQRFTRNALK